MGVLVPCVSKMLHCFVPPQSMANAIDRTVQMLYPRCKCTVYLCALYCKSGDGFHITPIKLQPADLTPRRRLQWGGHCQEDGGTLTPSVTSVGHPGNL